MEKEGSNAKAKPDRTKNWDYRDRVPKDVGAKNPFFSPDIKISEQKPAMMGMPFKIPWENKMTRVADVIATYCITSNPRTDAWPHHEFLESVPLTVVETVFDCASLNEYLHNLDETEAKVHHTEETQRLQKSVENFVNEIVASLDERWEAELIPSGSVYEGVKVGAPDEFDFMVQLNGLSRHVVNVDSYFNRTEDRFPENMKIYWRNGESDSFSFYNIGLDNVQTRATDEELAAQFNAPELWKDMFVRRFKQRNSNRHCDFTAGNVANIFYQEVVKLVERVTPCEGLKFLDISPSTKSQTYLNSKIERKVDDGFPVASPAAKLRLLWNGNELTNFEVDVDLAPVLKINGWPESSDVPERVLPTNPAYPHVQNMMSRGYHAVPKVMSGNMDFYNWRVSFSIPEKIIMHSFPPDSVHLRCLRVLKLLRDKFTAKGDDGHPILLTYWLKTMFYYECERYPHAADWAQDRLADRCLSILLHLHECLEWQHVPYYFISMRTLLVKYVDQFNHRRMPGIPKLFANADSKLKAIQNDIIKMLLNLNPKSKRTYPCEFQVLEATIKNDISKISG